MKKFEVTGDTINLIERSYFKTDVHEVLVIVYDDMRAAFTMSRQAPTQLSQRRRRHARGAGRDSLLPMKLIMVSHGFF